MFFIFWRSNTLTDIYPTLKCLPEIGTLKEVMLLLIVNAGPLPPEWKDHERVGDWRGHPECHAGIAQRTAAMAIGVEKVYAAKQVRGLFP